jgi:hypothetical protein
VTVKKSKLLKVMNETTESKEVFTPTEKDVIKWFRIINREIFNNELPMFKKIDIRRRHKVWGEVEAHENKNKKRYCNVSFHDKMFSKQHFIKILAHEMIHNYQWTIDNLDNMYHNDSFFRWNLVMSKFGITL